MRNFIQSVDIEAWKKIVKGPKIPLELHADDYREKLEDEYNELDWKKVSSNAKALNILHCALDATECNGISGCTSSKEVWDKLEVTYEGTNQVKESKANRLVREYELFEMKPGETISEMSTRFTDLVNVLKPLEKEFTEEELVKKVLDFSKFTYDELIGSFIAHEMLYDKSKSSVDDEKKKRGIALKLSQEDELKKTTAFKAASSDSSNSSSDEDDLAMITRRFKKAFKKGGSKYKKFLKKYSLKGETSKDQSEIKCFECNKPGHIKPNCPKLKKKNSKDKSKKALIAGWMDSDDSSSDNSSDKEVAHICLMALEEDKSESSQRREINTEANNSDSLSIEDYEDAFAKLYEEYKVYKKKCSVLNKEIASLRSENNYMSIIVQENKFYKNQMLLFDELNKELEDSKTACEKLIEKNRILETKVESLTNDLAKFTNGTQILDTLLGSQRLSNQKSDLGYDGFMHYGKYKNFFVKACSYSFPNVICFYCPSTTGDCLKWGVDRDQGHPTPKPTGPKDRIFHQKILSEEANTRLVDSLQKLDTENQKLQERIRQLEDQQHILRREVKRLRKEAMAEKTEFEEQETRWEKEKISLQATIKEVEVRNSELQEKVECQETFMGQFHSWLSDATLSFV
ncbi:uncharacterized protein LOC131176299 [Hevea brasiliensis]|uniref:uncharacterized protein LOC131176299 n=1 Tax=Hevea brasiliensis TaxID=3981 RepID=UPI0025F1BB99|nr:uncharacterized protein LOC131176299 [Hevea brasiliensis]